jgi:ketosteroid isomerase-like protein
MMADGCVFDASAGPNVNGQRSEGKRAVRGAYAAVFEAFPDAHWGNARHVVAGTRGVFGMDVHRHQKAGTRVEVTGCDLFTFRDGKIAVKNSYRKSRPAIRRAEIRRVHVCDSATTGPSSAVDSDSRIPLEGGRGGAARGAAGLRRERLHGSPARCLRIHESGHAAQHLPGPRAAIECLRSPERQHVSDSLSKAAIVPVSPKPGVLRSCFLKNGDVGVGVLPQREEIGVGAFRLHGLARECERSRPPQARHGVHRIDEHNAFDCRESS